MDFSLVSLTQNDRGAPSLQNDKVYFLCPSLRASKASVAIHKFKQTLPQKFKQSLKKPTPKTKFKPPYKLSQKIYDIVLINERNFVEIHFKRIYNGRRNAYCNKCRRTSRCRGKHKQF